MNLKHFFLIFICCTGLQSTFAQRGVRVGYIDMDYILKNIPEYQEAVQELDKRVQSWQSELVSMTKDVEEMTEDLNNERILLTPELIEEREEDIFYKEKEISEYKQKCFGPNGSLMVQKQVITQPIQDQVFNTVQQIATNKKFDFVFDKSADALMLYTADKYDISDVVLRSITKAYKAKQVKGKAAKRHLEKASQEDLSMANPEIAERQKALEEKKAARQKALDDRKAERERIRAEKLRIYEERKNQLLEERKRKRDSLKALLENKNIDNELKEESKDIGFSNQLE